MQSKTKSIVKIWPINLFMWSGNPAKHSSRQIYIKLVLANFNLKLSIFFFMHTMNATTRVGAVSICSFAGEFWRNYACQGMMGRKN